MRRSAKPAEAHGSAAARRDDRPLAGRIHMMRAWIFCSGLFLTSQILAQNTPDPEELERIEAAISKIQTEVASTRNQRSEVNKAIEESEKSIQAVMRQIEEINTLVKDKETRLPEMKKQAAE